MKRRNGFVSNSSSTCFTFLFKENDKKDIFKKLSKNRHQFDFMSVDSDDIINSITELIDKNRIYDVEITLIDLNERIEIEKEDISDNYRDDDWFAQFGYENIARHLDLILIFKKAYNNGYKYAASIYYGDNEGDECMTEVANTMKENADIIDGMVNEDFCIIVERNR